MFLHNFVDKVVILCLMHQGSIISWGRSVEHNSRLKGHPTSFHLCFLAVDILFQTIHRKEEAKQTCTRLGLHWNDTTNLTLHVQALPIVE